MDYGVKQGKMINPPCGTELTELHVGTVILFRSPSVITLTNPCWVQRLSVRKEWSKFSRWARTPQNFLVSCSSSGTAADWHVGWFGCPDFCGETSLLLFSLVCFSGSQTSGSIRFTTQGCTDKAKDLMLSQFKTTLKYSQFKYSQEYFFLWR